MLSSRKLAHMIFSLPYLCHKNPLSWNHCKWLIYCYSSGCADKISISFTSKDQLIGMTVKVWNKAYKSYQLDWENEKVHIGHLSHDWVNQNLEFLFHSDDKPGPFLGSCLCEGMNRIFLTRDWINLKMQEVVRGSGVLLQIFSLLLSLSNMILFILGDAYWQIHLSRKRIVERRSLPSFEHGYLTNIYTQKGPSLGGAKSCHWGQGKRRGWGAFCPHLCN